MIRLALRFDDPSATSNHELEAAIFEQLKRHGIAATVAVIPFRREEETYVALNSENGVHLVEACRNNVIEVALHGYSHEERGKTVAGAPSEFFGVPEDEQTQLIRAGKALLQDVFGREITGFVPPFNTHDKTTVSVLRQADFQYLSAGFNYSAEGGNLTFLPRSCQLVDIVEAVTEARRFSWLNPVVIGVMHHYDFRESGSELARIDIPGFAKRLAWIAAQKDICTLTLGELGSTCSGYTHLSQLKSMQRILPWRFSHRLPVRCLLPMPRFTWPFV